MTTANQTMDSRIATILVNVNTNANSKFVQNKYMTSINNIEETIKNNEKIKKRYKDMRSTIKECYLTGSLKYGKNFLL